jgi:3-isopropylmalate dehydrogenase
MLEHLGWSKEANRIESAVASAVEDGQTTVDIGGSLGTREAGEAIGARLRA